MYGRVARRVGILGAVVAVSGLAAPVTAVAAPKPPVLLHAQPATPVKGHEVAPVPAAKPQAAGPRRPLARALPTAGAADLPLGAAAGKVGGLPVALAPAAGARAGTTTGKVRVTVLDQATATKARLAGVLLRIAPAATAATGARTPATSAPPGRARLSVNYGQFRDSFGGDWADRLILFRLPTCGLSTPDKPGCAATPLPSHNDAASQTVTADVDIDASGTFALAAAPAGSTGDYQASSLAESGKWSVGEQSGDFNWSYPLRVPPSPGSLNPQFALSYSSGSVDGRTASQNAQPSTVGEGWGDLTPGFIERTYRSCADDGKAGSSDLCWGADNLTLSLNGQSAVLVKDDASGAWRPRDDDGSRIEHITSPGNGVNGNEAWRVTTQNGTQFSFGLNILPGGTTSSAPTNSAWTVPVIGNNSGEPCPNSCNQAWRWNLDYVKDPHGNAIAYYYTADTNKYGSAGKSYLRGGYLVRTDYGFRDGQAYTAGAVTGQVALAYADRCDPAVSGCTSFPDTPTDQTCTATSCSTTQVSPTFWVKKRLSSVTTKVLKNGALSNVDQWALAQSFPTPGDGQDAALWLDSVTHTGLVGGSIAEPAVTFEPIGLQNRVDTSTYPGMRKMRISSIHTDAGGVISVSYAGVQCTPTSLPAGPDSDTMQCFAQYWQPAREEPIKDWFHKHLVASVTESDPFSGSKTEETSYTYLDDPAWHFADVDETSLSSKRTWSEWRGFARVRVKHGNAAEKQSLTEDRFYRGMNGDHLANGGTRSASVTDSQGGVVTDDDGLAGQQREHIVYNGPVGAEVEGTIYKPFRSAATATHVHDTNVTVAAFRVRPDEEHRRVDLASGGPRLTDTSRDYDSDGRLTTVDDRGDAGTTADDRCATITYAGDRSRWMIAFPATRTTVAKACGTTASLPADGLPAARYFYDGSTTLGELKGAGDVTVTATSKAYDTRGPSAWVNSTRTYDSSGRVLSVKDGLNRPTTGSYTGAPVTTHKVTDALGNTTTTTLDPAWGLPTSTVDANGRRTDQTYDALGRLTAVWLPDRPKAGNSTGNYQYAYQLSKTGASWVRTDKLAASSGYLTSYALFDGQLRQRETQSPAEGGGRLVTETFYDTRGLPYLEFQPYFTGGAPAPALFTTTPTQVPAETVTSYDGAERVARSDSRRLDEELWHTDTAYHGDHVDVTPPAGGTPNTTFADARGHETEIRDYHGSTPSGAFDATKYGYDNTGRLTRITDNAGNVWTSTYDLLGRQTATTDPDAGSTAATYDDAGQLLTHTDGRGQTVAYSYDLLGRITGQFADSTGGARLAAWTYDTVPGPEGNPSKGLPASKTRFDNGQAYTVEVTGYDVDGRPTGTKTTIPAAEGELAGTYTNTNGYALNGAPAFTTMPAAGGLPAETLLNVYDAIDLPFTLKARNGTSYVTDSQYSSYGEPSVYTLSTGSGAPVQMSWDFEDGTHRLSRTRVIKQTSPASNESDVHYTYDPAGNLVTAADTPAGKPADTQCFDYDYARRLTDAWTPASGSCGAAPTAAAGILGGPAPYWESFGYDAAGDRTSQVRHDPGGTATKDVTQTYRYPAAATARPHAVQSVDTAGPGGSRTDTYGYDDSGETTSRPGATGPQTLNWDRLGHLASATAGGSTATYTYDADGNRLIERDATGSTLYLPDGTELRRNASTGVVTGTRYYAHNGSTVAMRTAAGVTWLATDPHGTGMQAISAGSGAVVNRRVDPFGNPRDGPPVAWPDTHGFLNKPIDPATGLSHLGAREYDPALGRFVTPDPELDPLDPQSLSGYSYADNGPTNNSDADGRICSNGPDGMCHTDHGNVPTPGLSDSQLGSVHGGGGGGSTGGGKGGGGGNGETKGEKLRLDNLNHEIAVAYTAQLLATLIASRPVIEIDGHKIIWEGAKVTTDRDSNRIEGGERDGSGRVGYADIILWTKGAVFVWEVKPSTTASRDFGRKQVDRYVEKLKIQLAGGGDKRAVYLGFGLPTQPPRGGDILSARGGTLRIFSKRDWPGLRLYVETKRPGQQAEPQPQEVPVPAPAPAPAPVPGGVHCAPAQAFGPCGPGQIPIAPGGGIGVFPFPLPGMPEMPGFPVPIPAF